MTLLVLTVALLSGADPQDEGRLTLRSGDRLSGVVGTIDAEGILRIKGQLLGGTVRARVDHLRKVELSGEAAAKADQALRQMVTAAEAAQPKIKLSARPVAITDKSPQQKVALADGSIITGQATSITSSKVELQDTLAGKLSIDRAQARAVVFSRFYSPDLPLRLKPDYLLFNNGDELSAEIVGLEQGKLSVAAFFGKATILASDVSFVAFKAEAAEPDAKDNNGAKDAKAASKAVEVTLVNGDCLRGEIALLDDKALKLQTRWAGPLVLPRESVAWLSFLAE
jgi:hypothetical protein